MRSRRPMHKTSAALDIEPCTANIATARRFVQSALQEWGYDYPGVVPLLTSEVVTNAVVHAGTPAHVEVSVEADHVRVAVHDLSPDEPVMEEPSSDAVGGRGMLLIRHLAADWGVESIEGDGKTVWFTAPVR
jgi:anti-sigma regulatory factor (Ser/Thr protein kinase)